MKGSQLVLNILNSPWAIMPEKLIEMYDVYFRHLHGEIVDISGFVEDGELENAEDQPSYENIGGVAVVEVEGVLAKMMNMFGAISGGTSTQMMMKAFNEAMEDSRIHTIVLNIDSPGRG